MAAKKGAGSTSADVPTSLENAIMPQGNDNSNSDNISVENVAEGDYEVHLHDLAISAEDIEAMKRIEPDWPMPSERNRKPRHQQGLRNNKYSQGQKVKKQRCPKPRKQSSTRS